MTKPQQGAKMQNIYVGATRPQLLPFLVLKYSIERTSTIPVKVNNLADLLREHDVSRGTPFSLQRLFIPQLNNYAGVALYLDSDMIVFSDIAELFQSQPFGEVVQGCVGRQGCNRPQQFSVFRIDCARAKHWAFEYGSFADFHDTQLTFEKSKVHCLSSDWNSLEYYCEGTTKLLHYTDMDRQPWLSSRNELGVLWYEMLKDALRNGAISRQVIWKEIKLGNVKPSLIRFCEDRERKASALEVLGDFVYAPPHTVARFFKSNNILTRSLTGLMMNFKLLFFK